MKYEKTFGNQSKFIIVRNINGIEEIMTTSTNFSTNPELVMTFDTLRDVRGFITRYLKSICEKLDRLQTLNEFQRTKIMIDIFSFKHVSIKEIVYTYDINKTMSHKYSMNKNYAARLEKSGYLDTIMGDADGVG